MSPESAGIIGALLFGALGAIVSVIALLKKQEVQLSILTYFSSVPSVSSCSKSLPHDFDFWSRTEAVAGWVV